MSWIKDQNGEKKYKVSIYTKEELPTWSEIYEEFYKKNICDWSPNIDNHQIKDLYWKIPRRKILLAMMANQLNKMIFEDGMRSDVLDYISQRMKKKCIDIRYVCDKINDKLNVSESWNAMLNRYYVGMDNPPPIYTYPMPNGSKNIFITSERISRIDISQIDHNISIFPIIMFQDNEQKSIYCPMHDVSFQKQDYYTLLDFILRDIIQYFEGSGVGWKDEDGNLINQKQDEPTCQVGYDPAL